MFQYLIKSKPITGLGSSLQTAFQFVCLSLTSFHICYIDSTQVDMSIVWAGDLA